MLPKILIIDDSQAVRSKIREMLPEGKFRILEAKDGIEGVECVQQQNPNVILLDFFMLHMNGWEVLMQIQGRPELQAIPLVVMSGRKEAVAEKVLEIFESFEFIEKPFERKALIEAIRSAAAKAKARREIGATPLKLLKPETIDSRFSSKELHGLQAEIQSLNEKIIRIQSEVGDLAKQATRIQALMGENSTQSAPPRRSQNQS